MNQNESCVYGIHAVEELLKNRLGAVDHIYFDKDKRSAPLFNLIKESRKERLAYNLVPEFKLTTLCGTNKHQGVVAVCSIKAYTSPEELKEQLKDKQSPLLVIAASIEDPSNLGAIIRSCVAFGVDALLLERKNTSPLNATVAKSSAGMVENLCIVRPKNLEGIIKEYVEMGYSVVGAIADEGVLPEKVVFTKPIILILGGEHRGIPPYLEKLCTDHVRIPIAATAQSLNVSAAGAVLLYECMRQRSFPNDIV